MDETEFEDLGFPWSMAAMTYAVLSDRSSLAQCEGRPYRGSEGEFPADAESRSAIRPPKLPGRERVAPGSDLPRSKVWLECNGELVDTRYVATIAIREAFPGVEMVNFVCPRCGQCHDSLRFC